jgi:hypothetical protein
MSEFPKAMYKAPGVEDIHGFKLDYRTVSDEQEQDGALAEGWFLTSQEAHDAYCDSRCGSTDAQETVATNGTSSTPELLLSLAEAADSAPASDDAATTDEDAGAADEPPTRDEMERKAKELGIKFDGRTTDKKLSAAIEAKLKG